MTITSETAETTSADVGGLPRGWRQVRFGDVVRQVKADVKPETSGLERYVAGEHIETDDLHIRRWGTIGDGYLGPAFHRKFVKGQVLYGSRRTYLRKVAVAEFDGICANTTFVLEPADDQVLSDLLPFIMQTDAFNEHSVKQSKGSVNPYVNFSDLAWYEFALPPIDEQRRIAQILWAADEVVSKVDTVIQAIDVAHSTLREHLLRFASGQDTRFADQDEKSVSLGNLLLSSPQSGFSAISATRDTGHYVLALSALTRSGYQHGQLKPVDLIPEVEATRLKAGDFLISRSNTIDLVGLVGIFDEARADVSFPDTMMHLVLDETRIEPRFLEQFMLSDAGRSSIRRIAAGTSASMKKINRTGLTSLQVPLPSLETQRAILEQLHSFTRVHNDSVRKSNAARVLKSSLLSRLLDDASIKAATNV